jgi:hypothetical protein
MTRYHLFLALAALSGTLQAQQITITNPVAGAQVPVGQVCAIAWTSEGLPAGTQLKIVVNVPGAHDQPVAAFVPVEAGRYQWLIPWACPTGNTATVRISLQNGGNSSPGTAGFWYGTNFALVPNPAPALILHAPVGGEKWPVGAARSVAWEPHNLAGSLTLNLLHGTNVVDNVRGIPVASNRVHYTLPVALPAGSDYTLRLTSDDAPSTAATSLPFSVVLQAPPPRKWSMLFYFDAAAFMQEAGAIQSFLDLGMMTPSTNINYVCQYARSPDYAITNYPWWGVKRFVMQQGITPAASNALQHLGNVSMADPNALTEFINWATENYPAENYFLILSDHGWGWRNGLLLDEVNGGRWMSNRELQQALDAADNPMTILGLDMCVEGDLEVAYQLRNTGPQILIASQFMESTNWPYHTVFKQLQSKLESDSLSLDSLAALFCDAFVALHSDPMATGTLAATRLHQMDALTAAVAGFADTMRTNSTDEAAVRHQATAVTAAFNDALIYCAKTRMLERQVYGLNIYFPTNASPSLTNEYGPRYVDFPISSHWASFLTAYGQSMTTSWIGEARATLPEDSALDLYRFCQTINPATNVVRLTLAAVGPGATVPMSNRGLFLTNGETLSIEAIPTPPILYPTTNYFVRWVGSANASIADPSVEQTSVTVTGDALVTAYFSASQSNYLVTFATEGNGSLDGTNSLTQVVRAGGDCSPVTALPDPGYAFAGWGGDYPATVNPLTVTNVQMDTTVIAFFWPAPPVISIQQIGASVNLTWPANPPGYVLESSGKVSGGPWNSVPGVNTNSVTLPISSANQFFRLRQEAEPQ